MNQRRQCRVQWLVCVCVLGLVSLDALGQSITIPIETQNNALVLQVNPQQDVTIAHLGRKLSNPAEYAHIPGQYRQARDYTGVYDAAYTPAGSRNLLEPALAVTHADGNMSLSLRYVDHRVERIDDNVSLLTVRLEDRVYPFQVALHYKSYRAQDLIELWSVIKHQEAGNVLLRQFASANLRLQADQFWLTHYHGDWAKEMQAQETKLSHGIKTLDSKLGARANLFQPSVFMLSLDQPAAEDHGTVLYGGLAWSGNFRIDLELDPQDNLRLLAGMNHYASAYTLAPQQTFATPAFWFVWSDHGKGQASRKLHDWARQYKLLDGHGDRLTLLNNWEATYFDFNEEKLFALFKDAKKLGVDLFLLDDGWFANKYPRNHDRAGLGDWQANRKKLPNGVSSLVQEATAQGVKFGIWIEPEMVNPKSELYETHPEWVIRQPQRDEHYFRNQLVLDLSNPEVQAFVFDVVDRLFRENPDLAYIKWDCNAVIYNAHSAYLTEQSHLYIDYVRGLYKVLERVRAKYPKVPMMLCSGGGGRVDYAALQYFTEFWPSDNTDPLERIFMQWEYSHFYPALSMACHVTNWGKQPIKFKTDVAMMGKLGFDIVIGELSDNDLAFCQQAVQNYHRYKQVIWHGQQYRLQDPKSHPVAALMYVDPARDTGVVFNYLVNSRYDQKSQTPIQWKGLAPEKTYTVREINLYPGTRSRIDAQQVYSGEFLMNIGFNPLVDAYRQSVVLVVEATQRN